MENPLAPTPAPPKRKGRPPMAASERRIPRTVTMTDVEFYILIRYGRGSVSAGIKRAAYMIDRHQLYDFDEVLAQPRIPT